MLLGLYHRRMEDVANSLFTLKQAKQIAVDHSETEHMGSILLNLAALEIQMGYFDAGKIGLKSS